MTSVAVCRAVALCTGHVMSLQLIDKQTSSVAVDHGSHSDVVRRENEDTEVRWLRPVCDVHLRCRSLTLYDERMRIEKSVLEVSRSIVCVCVCGLGMVV